MMYYTNGKILASMKRRYSYAFLSSTYNLIIRIGAWLWYPQICYSKSFEIGLSKLRESVSTQFEEIERIFLQREHQDLTLAIELLNVFRDDLDSKSLALPPFSGKLYELIIERPR